MEVLFSCLLMALLLDFRDFAFALRGREDKSTDQYVYVLSFTSRVEIFSDL